MNVDARGKLTDWRQLREPMAAVLRKSHAACCWHIVLDDMNLTRGAILFCVNAADEENCATCLALVPFVLAASLTQISKAAKRAAPMLGYNVPTPRLLDYPAQNPPPKKPPSRPSGS